MLVKCKGTAHTVASSHLYAGAVDKAQGTPRLREKPAPGCIVEFFVYKPYIQAIGDETVERMECLKPEATPHKVEAFGHDVVACYQQHILFDELLAPDLGSVQVLVVGSIKQCVKG